MPIQAGPQPLLIEIMGDETDAAAQDEETVEDAHVEVVLGLLGREGAAVAHEVDEADGDAAVDVEDEVVLLRRRHRLHRDGVLQHLAAREALLHEFLDQLHAQVRVVARFDFVPDSGN